MLRIVSILNFYYKEKLEKVIWYEFFCSYNVLRKYVVCGGLSWY